MQQEASQVQLLRRKETNTMIVYPHQLGNLDTAANEAVRALLFTYYNKEFQSIIIQVNSVAYDSELIATFDDLPYLLLEIEYSLTLLTLPRGSYVHGNLVQQFKTHLTIQLFGLFNVTVPEEEINPKQYKWSEEFTSYIYVNEVLEIGQLFQVQITNFESPEKTHFDITGSLNDRKKTGLVSKLSSENIVTTPSKIQRIIKRSQEKMIE